MPVKTSKRASKFHVGDRVTIRFAGADRDVMLVEDRGPIGHEGRHLWRIQTIQDSSNGAPNEFEVPEENIVAVVKAALKG